MTAAPRRGPRPAGLLATWAVAAALAFAVLVSLGTWQVQRRSWKLDLIARVEQRVQAPAVAAPGPGRWPQVNAADDEYRRVSVTGRYLHERAALVQAATELGSGYWVLTPLQRADGTLVLVNRGFVPLGTRGQATMPTGGEVGGEVGVTGLLRLSEPGGGFLRRNDPAADRWYSRDVAAIAAARGLRRVAPYFIDAQADDGPRPAGDAPVAGLTVIAFHNNHLVYAITWYVLAAMVAAAAWRVAREEQHLRRGLDLAD